MSKKSAAESEMSPGVLMSSGYIAGGAIGGIVIALFALAPDLFKPLRIGENWAWTQQDWPSMVAFGVLILLLTLVGLEKFLRPSTGSSPKKTPTGNES
jgi:hypothetical protein